jgi:hypothetical protein
MQAHKPRLTSRALRNSAEFRIFYFYQKKVEAASDGVQERRGSDGATGVLFWLEIQEGKKSMQKLPLVGLLGANAACALRILLGVLHCEGS